MIDALKARNWDVIVIGTGIGGGTIGRALAEKGLQVLFLEQGRAGYRAEETRLDLDMGDPVARSLRGFWPMPVAARIGGREVEFFAPLGAGPGGSSVFYAATLERPEPHDLDHSDARPHPTGGWPVSYAQMAPWLARAEALYHVRGGADPLSLDPGTLPPGPPLTEADRAMMERLKANGLHPYQLHAAIRHLPGCGECLGRKCPRACKMDARSAGVEPALATGNAALLCEAEVVAIRAGDRVSHLEVRHAGALHEFRARSYVLAGGALASPRLLLASASEKWPEGLGNANGLVGRGLMFHLNEMLAVWPRGAAQSPGPSKALSFRDLYWQDGRRYGTVQAMGIDVGEGEALHYLRLMIARSPWLSRLPGAGQLARLPAAMAARLMGSAKVFVGIIEDLPMDDNRVTLDPADPSRIRFTYDFPDELLMRRRAFRRAMRRAFAGQFRLFLGQAPEPNFGHPSGTLRMGNDPSTSVLDAECRLRGVANLWVADASIFPSSMGVNPSLTIAANALRVADRLAERISDDPDT